MHALAAGRKSAVGRKVGPGESNVNRGTKGFSAEDDAARRKLIDSTERCGESTVRRGITVSIIRRLLKQSICLLTSTLCRLGALWKGLKVNDASTHASLARALLTLSCLCKAATRLLRSDACLRSDHIA